MGTECLDGLESCPFCGTSFQSRIVKYIKEKLAIHCLWKHPLDYILFKRKFEQKSNSASQKSQRSEVILEAIVSDEDSRGPLEGVGASLRGHSEVKIPNAPQVSNGEKPKENQPMGRQKPTVVTTAKKTSTTSKAKPSPMMNDLRKRIQEKKSQKNGKNKTKSISTCKQQPFLKNRLQKIRGRRRPCEKLRGRPPSHHNPQERLDATPSTAKQWSLTDPERCLHNFEVCRIFPSCRGRLCTNLHPQCPTSVCIMQFQCPFEHADNLKGCHLCKRTIPGLSMWMKRLRCPHRKRIQCRAFPNCPNGDQCGYKHPMCKNIHCVRGSICRNRQLDHTRLPYFCEQCQDYTRNWRSKNTHC